ncbi:MAG: NifB/NifX family molybdenum-iron cluster-binding protein [Thiohalophilus sp.]|jgi:predicted Fe-Mo cluster-binding NifX family protein
MKIAIAATTPNTEGNISTHGARAEYYLIYDSVKDGIEAHSNPAAQAERGAGPQAAAYLINKGVEKVVAGQFGPKFRAELEGEGIDCIERTGAIADVITHG